MTIKNGHLVTFNRSIKEMKVGEVGYASTSAVTILQKTHEVYLDTGMAYKSQRFKEYQLTIKRISQQKEGFEIDFGSIYDGGRNDPKLPGFWLTSSLEFEDMGYKERQENVIVGKLDPKAAPLETTENVVFKKNLDGSSGSVL